MIFFSLGTAEWKGEMPESFRVYPFGMNGSEVEAGLSSWSKTEGVRFPPKRKAGLSLRQSPIFFCFLFNAKEDMVLIFKDLRERKMETKGTTESNYSYRTQKELRGWNEEGLDVEVGAGDEKSPTYCFTPTALALSVRFTVNKSVSMLKSRITSLK